VTCRVLASSGGGSARDASGQAVFTMFNRSGNSNFIAQVKRFSQETSWS
jgi:hypothetical protein